MEDFDPRPTGKPPEEITLVGKMIPAEEDYRSVLLRMKGRDDYFLPLFSSEEELRAFMTKAATPFVKIEVIYNSAEFLVSIPRSHRGARVRVIVDPKFTLEGRIRFLELQLS